MVLSEEHIRLKKRIYNKHMGYEENAKTSNSLREKQFIIFKKNVSHKQAVLFQHLLAVRKLRKTKIKWQLVSFTS